MFTRIFKTNYFIGLTFKNRKKKTVPMGIATIWMHLCHIHQYCDVKTGTILVYCDVKTGTILVYCDVKTGTILVYCDVKTGTILVYCDVKTGTILVYWMLKGKGTLVYCDVKTGTILVYCGVKMGTILVYWMLKGKGTSEVVVINYATYYFFLKFIPMFNIVHVSVYFLFLPSCGWWRETRTRLFF